MCDVKRNDRTCPRPTAERLPYAGVCVGGWGEGEDMPVRGEFELCAPHAAYLKKHGTTAVWDQEEFDRLNPHPGVEAQKKADRWWEPRSNR